MANILQNTQHTPTKWGANTPLGVGADSSRPYPDINKNVYFHNQIYISTLLNTYFHIIEYIHKFHCKRAFVPHFVGVFIYAGTINRTPTAADGLPITLRTDCHNILNKLQTHNQQPAKNTKNTKNNLNITLAHAHYNTIFI